MQKFLAIRNNIPNILTSLRIVGAISLLFTDLFSVWFFVIYSLCGVTDVLDGFFARRWKVTSRLGSVLDSIADLLFYAAALSFVAPYLWPILPTSFWVAIAVLLTSRVVFYLLCAIKFKKFAASHTYLNKLTGFSLFTVPYFIYFTPPIFVCWIVCVIALLACAEELAITICSKTYCPERKSIFVKPKTTEAQNLATDKADQMPNNGLKNAETEQNETQSAAATTNGDYDCAPHRN